MKAVGRILDEESEDMGSNPDSATYLGCDFEQMIVPFSVPSF